MLVDLAHRDMERITVRFGLDARTCYNLHVVLNYELSSSDVTEHGDEETGFISQGAGH